MHNAMQSSHVHNSQNTNSIEETFQTWDGSDLFFRAWHIWHTEQAPTRAIILFHGGHEHSGRFQDLVQRLNLPDYAIFAWDARGHGRSPGKRGYANHFQDYVRDADRFVRYLSGRYNIALEEMAVIGHSVGSVIAASWVNDYAPPIRAMVLGSPAFRIKLYVPAALPGLKILQRFRPNAEISSYVKPGMLTHDKQEADERSRDPLISPQISVRVLTSLFDTAQRITASANGIKTPTLLFSAGSDWVVHRSAHQRYFDNLGSEEKVFKALPDFYHEIFHEEDRQIPIDESRRFIERQFAQVTPNASRIGVQPCNQEIFERLKQPLSPLNPYYWGYLLTEQALKSVGRLSHGVQLGWESGFDSGRTLDYVYANKPRGIGLLGRLIDKNYLNSAGWAGIRQRRVHLEAQLNRAIDELKEKKSAIHIVDLAGGPGRYLTEVVHQRNDPALSAVCRDKDLAGLNEGRKLVRELGSTQVLHEPGDAFDPESIATLSPAPDIVIVSGLYELFQANEVVLRSLRAIYRQMQPGGLLIYTNQPHHPQLELIARTLRNRDGDRWVMRLRPQSEMNGLVKQAGFIPQAMNMDDAGIFTVTTAARGD